MLCLTSLTSARFHFGPPLLPERPKSTFKNVWVRFVQLRQRCKIFPCHRFEIDFVKVSDAEEAKEYGIDTLPTVLYFENRIPSVYDEDLNDENALLDWLIEQKTTDTIEKVTEEILEFLIEDEEYLAVFFSGPCEDDDPCDDILEELVSVWLSF